MTGVSNMHISPLPNYSSFFNSIIWEKDRFFYENTCFSLEPHRGHKTPCDAGCLNLYKTISAINEYRHFWTMHHDLLVRNVFEIGVWSGGSLIFWHNLFKPEKIVGIDLFERELSEYYRNYIVMHNLQDAIKIFWGVDQKNKEFLKKIISTEFRGPLDIVFDDGSHFYEETKISFLTLFPHIRPGGMYVIEDWSWSLMDPDLIPDETYFKDKIPLMELIIDLIIGIGKGNGMINNISIYQNFAVIERSAATIPEHGFSLGNPLG